MPPKKEPRQAPTDSAAGATTDAGTPGRSAAGKRAPKGKAKTGRARTPMMEQFWRAKDEAPNALLFFRMGDFYELFGDDAVTASRELGITLTKRDKGADAMPMAGVPVKAFEGYLLKLVQRGHHVAICEQLSDPKQSKGIVDRGIVRVVTAGTITEENALDARASNYLVALSQGKHQTGLAWVDLSTGRFHVAEVTPREAGDVLAGLAAAECLVAPSVEQSNPALWNELDRQFGARLTFREDWRFDADSMLRVTKRHFGVQTLLGFGLEDDSEAVRAAGALLEYLAETQKSACEHVRRIERSEPGEHLVLDRATRGCLELVETQRGARREGTLLDVLDTTRTPMGGRLLREWILNPLREVDSILARQRAVQELVEQPFLREEARETLGDIRDLERLVAKLSTGRANGRDLASLGQSTAQVPRLIELLSGRESVLLDALREGLDPLDDVTARIDRTLVDEPPLQIREGGVVRDGFAPELDELRTIAGDGKSWMARFQADESERAGIPGLKIGFNSVFGYFLEVPRGQVDRVPEHYIRKQTIKTGERYITPELKEFETKVLKAEDRAKELEYDIFCKLRDELAEAMPRILDTARAIAELDALASLAQKAVENRYVAPVVDDSGRLAIIEGRHPVLELSSAVETFVPNDTHLGPRDQAPPLTLGLLTGPNMAGKSTFIRQTALIVLLAQIGSFVPAESAHVGVVDRIFTRVGSGDDISRGESTFMVEMVEIAGILNNASKNSLIILDEVGRGTSTFDGLALAWSIAEFVETRIGARTLFATHYHQLTELAQVHEGAFNLSVAVRETGDEIAFLHKIVEGGTDRSYGIHVARLAGVPQDVIERAKQLLGEIEGDSENLAPRMAGTQTELASTPAPSSTAAAPLEATANSGAQQLSLFNAAPSEVERQLAELDLDRLTPIDALLALRELKERLGN